VLPVALVSCRMRRVLACLLCLLSLARALLYRYLEIFQEPASLTGWQGKAEDR